MSILALCSLFRAKFFLEYYAAHYFIFLFDYRYSLKVVDIADACTASNKALTLPALASDNVDV